MNEHPVPRNVTGFQFQLIGNMTLKQFGYLLFGFIIAFVIFKMPLSIFRYPFAAVSALLGVAFAFLPVNERPLEIWLLNLIKSIYSPTQYVWQKQITIPEVLMGKTSNQQSRAKETAVSHEDTTRKLEAYLASIQQGSHSTLDQNETRSLSTVKSLFSQKIPVKAVSYPPLRPDPIPDVPAAIRKQTMTAAQPQSVSKTAAAQNPAAQTKPGSVQLPTGIVSGLIRTGVTNLPNILVHITNSEGIQVRLLKSNAEGKFKTGIPLDPGFYHVKIEDPSGTYTFRPFSFTVSGGSIHPWLLMPAD